MSLLRKDEIQRLPSPLQTLPLELVEVNAQQTDSNPKEVQPLQVWFLGLEFFLELMGESLDFVGEMTCAWFALKFALNFMGEITITCLKVCLSQSLREK